MTQQQTLQDLLQFEIPGVLTFAPAQGGLLAAHITTPAAEAIVYVQGAHLTHWQPQGFSPVLFLSDRSEFTAGKAIRGGIPVIFPWFGDRSDGHSGPAHGFARISGWHLAFAGLSGSSDDPALHLVWTLDPTELSRSLGFDRFHVAYRMTIGRKLTLELTVAYLNTPAEDAHPPAHFVFEEAFHTYFAVADARQVTIEGLAHTDYLDKVDNAQRKRQHDPRLHLTGRTDRPYLNTAAACILHDPAGYRRIVIAKSGSQSTVVWNPWQELTAKMPDLAPDAWQHFTCIETANVGENAITLPPGAAHTMRAEISVEAYD